MRKFIHEDTTGWLAFIICIAFIRELPDNYDLEMNALKYALKAKLTEKGAEKLNRAFI